MLPDGFVFLCEAIPGIKQQVRYASAHNLTGHPLAGYHIPTAVGTVQMANALKEAFSAAQSMGYGMLIYDAYRPQKAVTDFVTWSLQSENGETKAEFYPSLNKSRLFPEGYIASRSGHSRGSTVDLTLLDASGIPLDMGTAFDFMDDLSHHGAFDDETPQGQARKLLLDLMTKAGFVPYENEWWHYRLANEPYPDTYFDFDIE